MGKIDCQGLLFDLDGVLVDSTPAVARVWTIWARKHGFDPCAFDWPDLIRRFTLRHPNGDPYKPEEFPSRRVIQGEAISDEKAILTTESGETRTILVTASPV